MKTKASCILNKHTSTKLHPWSSVHSDFVKRIPRRFHDGESKDLKNKLHSFLSTSSQIWQSHIRHDSDQKARLGDTRTLIQEHTQMPSSKSKASNTHPTPNHDMLASSIPWEGKSLLMTCKIVLED